MAELGQLIAMKSLESFESLENDWDGYGAEPLSQSILDRSKAALRLIATNAPMPELVPNSNGTLSMEWNGGGARAECAHC